MIRLATNDDEQGVERLCRLLDASHVERGEASQLLLLTWAAQFGITAHEPVVVAEDDQGDLVGLVLWVHLPGTEEGLVTAFGTYVLPDHRRSNLSTEMRDYASEQCWQRGYQRIEGAVFAWNDAGLKAVEKAGFKVVGVVVRKERADDLH